MQLGLFEDNEFKPPKPPKKETQYAIKKQATPTLVRVRRPLPAEVIIRLSGTGHRPDKLGGYHRLARSRGIVVPFLVNYLLNCHAVMATNPSDRIVVISGMAQGWDTWLMEAALESGVCYTVAAVPCPNQGCKWPDKPRDLYNRLCELADSYVEVWNVYDYDCMQLRNEYMSDNCDLVLAMWNGTSGGTGNCIRYCDQVGMGYLNFWEDLSCLIV